MYLSFNNSFTMSHYPAHSKIYHIKADSLDTTKINTDKQHSTYNKKITQNVNIPSLINENSNSLSGLLAHYDSDSEHEEINGQESVKLDAKVDDFLQEINKITPTENKPETPGINHPTCAWQECFDESTGYPYYWNVDSNAVTWDMPEEYKSWITQNKILETKPPDNETLVTHKKQLHLSMKKPTPETKEKPSTTATKSNNRKWVKKVNKTQKASSDSEDEKIVMITSFSEESSSESDTEKSKEAEKVIEPIKTEPPLMVMGPHIEDIPKETPNMPEIPNKKEIIENVKEEKIDETVILARLRTQAKVLHELGGELPKSIDKSIISLDKDKIEKVNSFKPQSLSLVAGYGDDSDPEEELPLKSLFPIPTLENNKDSVINEQTQSTLFPATKPIDVKQFELPNSSKPSFSTTSTTLSTTKDADNDTILLDNKIFKRKKRLGIAFDVKTEKRFKSTENDSDFLGQERKGFGFQTSSDLENKNPFKKSGIAFVKADTLNPGLVNEYSTGENEEKIEDYQEIKDIVSEKVHFLGEGKDPVSAVQIMSIQLSTLEAAYKASGLTKKYLYSWLRETFKELEKLEQEAAPEGWKCQWDRSNKRYFYRNALTGETQWQFPQPDIVGGGEAMDICTTPPPNEEAEATASADDVAVVNPPPLPKITERGTTPSPPPPPVITLNETSKRTTKSEDEIAPPIPSAPPPIDATPPPPPAISVSDSQPLPPGVDSPDLPYFGTKQKDKESSTGKGDSLGSELDSFYSDIALLEAATGSSIETGKIDVENVPSPSSAVESLGNENAAKKKKKSKTKLGQGINMKKKAVSTLVEKWKKVQNDYL